MLSLGGSIRGGGSGRGRGVWQGEGEGRGQGTFQSSCHVLHYHMVLRPKGTSHNETKFPRAERTSRLSSRSKMIRSDTI